MNKAGRFALTVLILIVASGLLAAQEPSDAAPAPVPAAIPIATGPSKIMFVNFGQVLSETEEAKQEFARISGFVDQKNQENESKTQDLQNRQQQYAEQERALNPQTAAEMQREIAKLGKDLERFREDIQDEIGAQRNMAFANLGQKIQTVVGESAEQNGYSAILYLDSLAQNGLGGYFDPAYDITQDIIDRYNIKYPAAAAAPATPGQ